LSVVVCNVAGGRARWPGACMGTRRGNAAGGRAGRPPSAWAVGWPTLHGGSVRLRPFRETLCWSMIAFFFYSTCILTSRLGELFAHVILYHVFRESFYCQPLYEKCSVGGVSTVGVQQPVQVAR